MLSLLISNLVTHTTEQYLNLTMIWTKNNEI